MFMLNKLAFKNAQRQWKDYVIYFFTLCMVVALMLAFNSLLFSSDIYKLVNFNENNEMSTAATMLITFLVVATIIIIMIMIWLINYMTHFMLEQRSREFSVYLLVGMKRTQISKLYMKENVLLGIVALIFGIFVGIGLQQLIFYMFYRSVGKHYLLKLSISLKCLGLTIALYMICFCIALIRNKKKFSKMQIIQLMNMDKQNEVINEKKSGALQILFYISIANILLFYYLLLTGNMSKAGIILEMIGIVFMFYFLYLGLSAFLVRYVHNAGKLIYKKQNIFIIRQFSSKLKNTCFTLGTLSLLFTFSLLGSSLALMLSDYQAKQLNIEYPFDIIILSNNVTDDFQKELTVIKSNIEVKEHYQYNVYENKTCDFRNFLCQNLTTFMNKEESSEMTQIRQDIDYYTYDEYMKLTDYNSLRVMLGYQEVELRENEYIIQMPNRVYRDIENLQDEFLKSLNLELEFKGIQTEGFAQSGHNGADYIIIVPDHFVEEMGMSKYFSLLAVMADENVPENLSEMLYDINDKVRGYDEINDYIKIGSEEIFLTPATIQVKSREITELRFLMSTLSFPLFYVGLVFLCISLTVLSIQQLSDSNKYRFRYTILNNIGMKRREIRWIIIKQLFIYYICPIVIASIISSVVILYIGKQFVMHTGINTYWLQYFLSSLFVFIGVYIIYFGITCWQFIKNIEKKR